MTTFTSGRHGWHFDNDFVNHLLGGLITTRGLCGGMAYSSLDYYFNGIPIPTHRAGDFGDPIKVPCPPDGRLRSMIFNRLIDSFKDNFDKWSCIYPDLDAAVGAALGLVLGGGLIGGLIGAVGGWVYGELHEAFACPGGGAAGMTRPTHVGVGLVRRRGIELGGEHDRGLPGLAGRGSLSAQDEQRTRRPAQHGRRRFMSQVRSSARNRCETGS